MDLETYPLYLHVQYLHRGVLNDLGKCDRATNLNQFTRVLNIAVHVFKNILELLFVLLGEDRVHHWFFFAVRLQQQMSHQCSKTLSTGCLNMVITFSELPLQHGRDFR